MIHFNKISSFLFIHLDCIVLIFKNKNRFYIYTTLSKLNFLYLFRITTLFEYKYTDTYAHYTQLIVSISNKVKHI